MVNDATGNCKKSIQHLELNLKQKRAVVLALGQIYPVQSVCEVLDCARSSSYYQAIGRDEAALRADIERLTGDWVTYGCRHITQMLHREGWAVNHKRVRRLMQELGLLQKRQRPQPRTTNNNHSYGRYPNRVQDLGMTYPHQVWVADITYVRLGQGHVYLAVLMDVYTRAIWGWQLSRNLDAQSLTLPALQCALTHHCPTIHYSDQVWQ